MIEDEFGTKYDVREFVIEYGKHFNIWNELAKAFIELEDSLMGKSTKHVILIIQLLRNLKKHIPSSLEVEDIDLVDFLDEYYGDE